MSFFLRSEIKLITAFVILVFTLASTLSINQYRFGIADQSLMIPFLKISLNPNLYASDYALPQRSSYLTYLWQGLGLIVKYLKIDISTVFFVSYLISLYMTFLAIYLIALTLFKKREAAFLSLFFLLFTKATLAGAATLENILLARTVALPILLFSLLFFLREGYLVSFVLAGTGFLIHPLSAAYVTTGLLISSLLNLKKIGLRRLIRGIMVLLIAASPVFAWKFSQTLALNEFFSADSQWVKILKLRLPHHLFPLSWSRGSFFQAMLAFLTFLITFKHKPQIRLHRLVLGFVLGILITCLIGIIFSEFLPLAIVLNLQTLRSFKFILYLVMIYFANYFWAELKQKKNIFDQLSVGLVSVGIFYGATGWQYAYLAFLTLTLFLIFHYLVFPRKRPLRPFLFLTILIVIALSLGAYFKKGRFSIANAQEEKWLDIQRWAKKNTDTQDLFIVPLNSEGFRVESERSIFGDWKDGCLAVFNPQFAYEWARRMEKLGFGKGFIFQEGFANLKEKDFTEIADEAKESSQKIFLVMFKKREPLEFPAVYQNEKFVIYEVVSSQGLSPNY